MKDVQNIYDMIICKNIQMIAYINLMYVSTHSRDKDVVKDILDTK
jgi:hypothetical protein